MATLKPRARIIRTIGDQLISGPEAAVIELVKNSYDADSSTVEIKLSPPTTLYPAGRVLVTDHGHGMTYEDIEGKWFEPASDNKVQRQISPRGRIMLGAKGIGRFAAARLGSQLALESVPALITTNPERITLEAELGIRPNSVSGPDFHGWEIKQHGVVALEKPASGVLTLMTPEPDGGDYKQIGVGRFIEKYGYADRIGRKDRFNFGGVYKAGRPVALTGLRLEVHGFDDKKGRFEANGSVALMDARDHVAASWSFAALLTIWTRKHAQAAFVPSICRKDRSSAYRYGSSVHLGIGTDFARFLSSMTAGCVYYDPGIKLERASGKAKIKRRSQFRVNFRDLHALYASFQFVDVTTEGRLV